MKNTKPLRKTKKLRIDKERIRKLTDQEAADAAGATSWTLLCTFTCYTCWPWQGCNG